MLLSCSVARRSDKAAGRPVTAQRWPSLSGLRTTRTVWIRPSTTSTVSTLHTRISACRDDVPADGPCALHERGELLRVDVVGCQELQRPLGRESLGLPELRFCRPSHQAAGLAVDPDQPGLEVARSGAHPGDGGHEARDARGTDQRLPRRHRLAAAVGVEDRVLGEQLLQGLQVALLGGREEPCEQGFAGGLVGVEARAPGLDVLPRPRHELPRVHLGLLDDRGDLRVLVPERLAEQVGRPLDRGQPLHEHQHGERQRLRELGAGVWARHGVLEQRLRQPRPDIRLAADPRRPEDVDREPHRHRRHPGGRLVDRALLARQAQQRLLGDVLGLRDAAEHPVRDAEAVAPQRLELRRAHHACSPRSRSGGSAARRACRRRARSALRSGAARRVRR